MNVTLFEIGSLETYLRVSTENHLGFRVGPQSNDWCPHKGKERGIWDRHTGKKVTWRQRLRWEGCSPKPSSPWSLQDLEEERKDPPLEPSEGVWPCWHRGFRFMDSRVVREYSSLSSRVTCYGSPMKQIHYIFEEKKKTTEWKYSLMYRTTWKCPLPFFPPLEQWEKRFKQ